jgi:glycosyltransferase involved in cell wall biosynthesis
MRIAIFTELYSPSVGGQEMFFAGLGKALQRRGHKIDVYCVGHDTKLATKEVIDNLTINRFPIVASYKKPIIRSLRRNWLAIARYAWFVRSVARKKEHDFYLLNQWPLLHAIVLPRQASRHALLHWCETRNSLFFRIVQSILPKYVNMNAGISEAVCTEIHRTSGVDVITMPSGIDLWRLKPVNDKQRRGIVVLGRITEHKNLPFLIEAFERLCANGYSGRLSIAGDGPAMPELRDRVEVSPVKAQIDLLGFISDEMKFTLLAGCEVLAIPSKREGFPHVASEAMCSGVPIVTADFPENGTKTIVQQFDCGVVTEPDPAAFAQGIAAALSHWDVYSANGKAVSGQLDWSKIAERLEGRLQGTLECQASTR